MTGYQYLATVYSKHRLGIDIAWRESCRYAAQFIKAGVPVFCPIAHSHQIATQGLINPRDHSIWLPADLPLMEGAAGLIVVTSEGWRESAGIAAEIEHFTKAGKPIVYWEPDTPILVGLFDPDKPAKAQGGRL